jgi:sugar phosphate isomerase/epimerase
MARNPILQRDEQAAEKDSAIINVYIRNWHRRRAVTVSHSHSRPMTYDGFRRTNARRAHFQFRGLAVQPTRRDFLKGGAASVAAGSALFHSALLHAATLHLPLGLQLYSVRDLLPKDYDGTLKQLGGLGFKDAESAGYFGRTPEQAKASIGAAGLNLVSAHYPMTSLRTKLDDAISFSKAVGVRTIICSSPELKDPLRLKTMTPEQRHHAFGLEDWHWNAEQLNTIGEKVHGAGLNFGYHNHYTEFHITDGKLPYDELARLTDPAKVTMEMDCGWVVIGGGNPVEMLRKHGKRITMLHVKDFKPIQITPGVGAEGEPSPIELGHGGIIDYRPIFDEAAKAGNIKHIFVEQEAFTVPPMESLKMDADYMHKLGIV